MGGYIVEQLRGEEIVELIQIFYTPDCNSAVITFIWQFYCKFNEVLYEGGITWKLDIESYTNQL